MDGKKKRDTSLKRSHRTGQVSVKPVGSEDQQQFGGVPLHEPVSGGVEKNLENQRKKEIKTLPDEKNLFLEKNTKNLDEIKNLSIDNMEKNSKKSDEFENSRYDINEKEKKSKNEQSKRESASYVPTLAGGSEDNKQPGGGDLHQQVTVASGNQIQEKERFTIISPSKFLENLDKDCSNTADLQLLEDEDLINLASRYDIKKIKAEMKEKEILTVPEI